MYSIGQFSRITGLTVKALRFYQEKELLVPSFVNPETRYRYYTDDDMERARVIALLKEMTLSIEEMQRFLAGHTHEEDARAFLRRKRDALRAEAERLGHAMRAIDDAMAGADDGAPAEPAAEVVRREVPAMEVLMVRRRGRYADAGKAFGALARSAGRHAAGPPCSLYHEADYNPDDADIAWCLPVRPGTEGAVTLPGGSFWGLRYTGPYEQIGRAYRALYGRIREETLPIREVYVKGPGLLFRGNPRRYITDILVPAGPAGPQG